MEQLLICQDIGTDTTSKSVVSAYVAEAEAAQRPERKLVQHGMQFRRSVCGKHMRRNELKPEVPALTPQSQPRLGVIKTVD